MVKKATNPAINFVTITPNLPTAHVDYGCKVSPDQTRAVSMEEDTGTGVYRVRLMARGQAGEEWTILGDYTTSDEDHADHIFNLLFKRG